MLVSETIVFGGRPLAKAARRSQAVASNRISGGGPARGGAALAGAYRSCVIPGNTFWASLAASTGRSPVAPARARGVGEMLASCTARRLRGAFIQLWIYRGLCVWCRGPLPLGLATLGLPLGGGRRRLVSLQLGHRFFRYYSPYALFCRGRPPVFIFTRGPHRQCCVGALLFQTSAIPPDPPPLRPTAWPQWATWRSMHIDISQTGGRASHSIQGAGVS